MGVGVAVWEMTCPRGEMLSHGYDNFLRQHPFITWVATVATAAHLLNVLDDNRVAWLDPWTAFGLSR